MCVGAWDESDGLDLAATPTRVAKMYVNELFSSYHVGALERLREQFTVFPAADQESVVSQVRVPFSSSCAHHLLPFVGHASVVYLPGNKIVGLSKIARTVKFFSRKLQTQERLTNEIADFLCEELKPKSLMVILEANHLCMQCRGVEIADVLTRTSAVRGLALISHSVKSEFLSLLTK